MIDTQEDYLNTFDNPHQNYPKLYRFMTIGDKNIDRCYIVTQKMFPNMMRATKSIICSQVVKHSKSDSYICLVFAVSCYTVHT